MADGIVLVHDLKVDPMHSQETYISSSPSAGARPKYLGKWLVAIKHMKKKWEGGWNECQKLKELKVSNAIYYPLH